MNMAGFSVSDKAAKDSRSIEAMDLGVKLQSGKLLVPSKMMMMVHHDNHHRPFPPYAIGYGDVDASGPKSNNYRPKTSNIYDVLASSDYGSGAAAAAVGGAVGASTLQASDISPTTTSTAHTTFKSPAGGMEASLEFPFTRAQWKELERQAMIYKYMKASVPVPPDLLIPITGSLSVPLDSHFALGGGALNPRFSNRGDVEPGRCRRTDGKKWRCSRDVAPNQKYCERHLHRGRPRSRKPVEQLPNKKTHHTHTPSVSSSSSNNLTKNASPSQFIATPAQPFQQNQTACFLDKPSEKATFWPLASVSSYKEPRNSDWILNEELISLASSDQQWHQLMQIGTTASSFFNADNPFVLNQNYNKELLSLNSYAYFHATENQQSTGCPLFLNSEIVPLQKSPEGTSRSFIDAWSTGNISGDHNANSGAETSVSSNGKLSLSSLSLSVGVNNVRDDEMGPIRMGLGLSDSDQNHEYASKWLAPASWAASTPGGPLAEVLRPSSTTTAAAAREGSSNPSSPIIGNGNSCSPPVTAVSSPSGVLQRTLASFSDSSCSTSSPTLASSGAKP